MANKNVSYIQVPVIQENVREVHLVALNAEATIFQLTATYEVKDSEGTLRGTGQVTAQVTTQPDPVHITAILAAANAQQGT